MKPSWVVSDYEKIEDVCEMMLCMLTSSTEGFGMCSRVPILLVHIFHGRFILKLSLFPMWTNFFGRNHCCSLSFPRTTICWFVSLNVGSNVSSFLNDKRFWKGDGAESDYYSRLISNGRSPSNLRSVLWYEAIDGSKFVKLKDQTYETTYSFAKLIGTLWSASMSRKFPDFRFVAVTPGKMFGCRNVLFLFIHCCLHCHLRLNI